MLEFFNPQNLNAFWARLTSGHAFAATALVLGVLLLVRTSSGNSSVVLELSKSE